MANNIRRKYILSKYNLKEEDLNVYDNLFIAREELDIIWAIGYNDVCDVDEVKSRINRLRKEIAGRKIRTTTSRA